MLFCYCVGLKKMKKLFYKNIVWMFGVLFFAMLLGTLQCKMLNVKFHHLCSIENYYPDIYDFFSYIVVGDNVGEIFYLSWNDMGLMFQPLSFLLFGLFVSVSNFLTKPKGYYQFIYARKYKERNFVNGLFTEQVALIFIYSVAYYVSVFCYGYIGGYAITGWDKILTALVLGAVSKIVFLLFVKEIVLYIYLRRGLTDSILAGFVLVVILLMIDAKMKCQKINLLLFSSALNFQGMLLILVLCVIVHIINRKIDLLKLE